MLQKLMHWPVLMLLTLFLFACDLTDQPVVTEPDNTALHLLMGNPSAADDDPANAGNYLISLPQYALSYNRTRGIPNWVSWHLSTTWLGDIPRQDDFRAYTALPAGWHTVSSFDYVGSGFDRGHNCPSADRTLTVADNSSTFYMINMIPQAPAVNQGPWERLESYCRKLARQGHELYIVMGNYGLGGTGNNGTASTLAGGKVAVPAVTWKAILILPLGSNDLSRVDENTRVIAVSIPNQNVAGNLSWGDYRTTVRQIETTTGYDIFSAVPLNIQNKIETRVDTGPTE
jgi:endonuclease G, mitochondrial